MLLRNINKEAVQVGRPLYLADIGKYGLCSAYGNRKKTVPNS